MAEAAPVFGNEANLLLRGAPDIGAGGLLRFYLLHVVLLPLAAILVISIHYYKVSREHGISLPASMEEGDVPADVKKNARQRIDFIPDLFTHEIFLVSLGLFAMVAGVTIFGYSAPLETIANPQVTPLDTKAPWYFWWLQGMLKLGDKSLMGIVLPTILVLLLVGVPYIDRNPHRSMYKRPFAVGIGILSILVLVVLSYMGLPEYGIQTPAATRIIQDLVPEEGVGPLRAVPYEQLNAGIYEVGESVPRDLCPALDFGCPELTAVFREYSERVNFAANQEGLQPFERLPEAQAVMVIEDWQTDLKKITLRINWNDVETGGAKSYEKHLFLHRERVHE
jgi:hypothetical protein